MLFSTTFKDCKDLLWQVRVGRVPESLTNLVSGCQPSKGLGKAAATKSGRDRMGHVGHVEVRHGIGK
jgi:hypothetical protein